jgi:hypothetical protein
MKYILISVEDDKYDALLAHYQNLAKHPASSVVAVEVSNLEVPGPYSEYIHNLMRRSLDKDLTREERYRAQAELEDMTDGHWDGHRTDDPPAAWWDINDPVT